MISDAAASANILSLASRSFTDLPGWETDDHAAALATFRRSAAVMETQFALHGEDPCFAGSWADWSMACAAADKARDARQFFETHFRPFLVHDVARPQGLFTGYYEPLASGSLTATAEFKVPIYAAPADLVPFDAETEARLGVRYGRLVGGTALPYFTRREIEQGALAGRGLELLWLNSWEDAFFIHVQGSGRVRLPDGQELRLAFAAKSGQPYTSIGAVLMKRGELTKERLSMQSLRAWMADHPAEARELMWQNKSFIFFRRMEIGDQSLGAPGAQHVNLTPLRSLAVDRSLWAFGTPVWLDMMTPTGPKAEQQPFRHLLIAQDTGSAIKGPARGDVYWGWGEQAALTAGHMASPGSMTVLLPNALAQKVERAS